MAQAPQDPFIASLQRALDQQGYKVVADGRWGPQTERALKELQEAAGLRPTGTVDEETLAKLGLELSDEPQDSVRTEDRTAGDQVQKEAPPREPEPDEVSEEETVASVEEAEAADETPESRVVSPVALSDKAADSLEADRLGFRPSVEAVVRFLLSEQTEPPLTLAIHAPWGAGKTSFMNMIDGHVQVEARRVGGNVATVWFNPWQYSAAEQVWGAFVATVVRAVQEHQDFFNKLVFRLRRFWSMFWRQLTISLALRLIVVFLIAAVVLGLLFGGAAGGLIKALETEKAIAPIITAVKGSKVAFVLEATIVFLAIFYVYVTLSNKLGLNLLQYVEKTGFKDKIGTIAQFESEMKALRKCTPKSLKLVVFIDDLDRCNADVLREVVEALQLTEVSQSCIFIIGMDLTIVAQTIEDSLGNLARAVGGLDRDLMEHGSGYKFLEKIIQARLSIPNYGREEIKKLTDDEDESDQGDGETEDKAPRGPVWMTDLISPAATRPFGVGLLKKQEAAPQDSAEVLRIRQKYGPEHFNNPRRYKRFVNSFRLHAYLLDRQKKEIGLETLARFLVLAEKWPAMLAYLLESQEKFDKWRTKYSLIGNDTSTKALGAVLKKVKEDTASFTRLRKLVCGEPRQNVRPLEYEEIRDLAKWYGFHHHVSREKK